jgi:hypothetical protein
MNVHCKKVSDIPAGDGKIANLFLQCKISSIKFNYVYMFLNVPIILLVSSVAVYEMMAPWAP